MVEAVPGWLCIPAPTMLTLAQLIVDGDLISAKAGLVDSGTARAVFSFALGAGKDHILATSAAGETARMISTLMFFCASRLNTLKDIPGTSGNFQDRNNSDVLIFCNAFDQHTFHFVSSYTNGAGHRVMLDRTSSSTPYFLASSYTAVVEHLCPGDASSSISSKVISFRRVALGILRGSAVYTFHIGIDSGDGLHAERVPRQRRKYQLPPRPGW